MRGVRRESRRGEGTEVTEDETTVVRFRSRFETILDDEGINGGMERGKRVRGLGFSTPITTVVRKER